MLIPLIVIGVLFLITWIVIGVSNTPVDPAFLPEKDSGVSWYEYEALQSENSRLRHTVTSLEWEIRRYRDPYYPLLSGDIDTEAILELLQEQKDLPKELKINNKKYKAQ